jgi:hypothetical protein
MADNLLGIPETLLQPDPAAPLLEQGEDPQVVAARHPASSLVWAVLAERALDDGRTIEGYAYARTGYHRSLDSLRKSGWRGQGPVPWSHEPNRGFLRSLAALSRAAGAISETAEQRRCADFLRDSSREGAEALGL